MNRLRADQIQSYNGVAYLTLPEGTYSYRWVDGTVRKLAGNLIYRDIGTAPKGLEDDEQIRAHVLRIDRQNNTLEGEKK